MLPIDTGRVHDRISEAVLAGYRRSITGGVAVILPPGFKRLHLVSEVIDRLHMNCPQPPRCLIVSPRGQLLGMLADVQSQRYNVPSTDVCHQLDSGTDMLPRQICSLSTARNLASRNLTEFGVVIVLGTSAAAMQQRGFMTTLHHISMCSFLVVVTPTEAGLDQLPHLSDRVHARSFL